MTGYIRRKNDNIFKKIEILYKEYQYRDSLIVREFDIGIVGIALLITALAYIKCNNIDGCNTYLTILIYIVGIFAIFTLIISLYKLSRVRDFAKEELERLDMYFLKEKIKSEKRWFKWLKVKNLMIYSMVEILIIWTIFFIIEIIEYIHNVLCLI